MSVTSNIEMSRALAQQLHAAGHSTRAAAQVLVKKHRQYRPTVWPVNEPLVILHQDGQADKPFAVSMEHPFGSDTLYLMTFAEALRSGFVGQERMVQ